MKRIGITQRVSTQFHGQPHDCLDTAWSDLLLSLERLPIPLPNIEAAPATIEAYLDAVSLDGLILSGGNDISGFGEVRGSEVSERREAFERAAVDWAMRREIPILAACRGMQFLNVILGGGLSAIRGHAGVPHAVLRVDDALPEAIESLPERLSVNSFHNFAVTTGQLAPDLRPAAIDADGNVEAYFHPSRPIVGTMWHPERPGDSEEFDRHVITKLFG